MAIFVSEGKEVMKILPLAKSNGPLSFSQRTKKNMNPSEEFQRPKVQFIEYFVKKLNSG